MDKDALVERFWDLIECSEEGYATAVRLLRGAARPEELGPVADDLAALPEDRSGSVSHIVRLLEAIREEELRPLVEQLDQIGAYCQECGEPCDRDSELCYDCEAKAEAKATAVAPKPPKPAGFLARLFGKR
jgi:hypothetical protein